MMVEQNEAARKGSKRTAPKTDLKLLQARLPKDLVVAFRTFVIGSDTTVRALLEELIRERLKREGYETESS